jgi:hypothetical protein
MANFKLFLAASSTQSSAALGASSYTALGKTNGTVASAIEKKATNAQEESILGMIESNDPGFAAQAERNKNKVDRNFDGELSFTEKLRYALDSGSITEGQINAFLMADRNGDGSISKQEKAALNAQKKMSETQSAVVSKIR